MCSEYVFRVKLGALHHKNKSRPFAELTNRQKAMEREIIYVAVERACVKLNAIMFFMIVYFF